MHSMMTRRLSCVLALLPACMAAPLPMEVAAPPVVHELEADPVLRGEAMTFVVTQLTPNRPTFLFGSGRGLGAGPCAPNGTTCLDLERPTMLATGRADASGSWSVTVQVPPNIPVPELWFQAVTLDGVSDVEHRVVDDADLDGLAAPADCDDTVASCTTDCSDADSDGLAECAGDDCLDVDGDGYGVGNCLGEDCDDTRVDVYPGAPDVVSDGVDTNCDFAIGCADGDGDGDGICDPVDLCVGDDTTGDADGDGTCTNLDACPADPGRTSGNCRDENVCDALSALARTEPAGTASTSVNLFFGFFEDSSSAAALEDGIYSRAVLDPVEDVEATLEYAWARDGVDAQISDRVVSWRETSVGEVWAGTATATFLDGTQCSSPTSTTQVVAGAGLTIEYADAVQAGDTCPAAECLYGVGDDDPAADIDVTITWTDDGVLLPATGAVLDPTVAAQTTGAVRCVVEATYDGTTVSRTSNRFVRPSQFVQPDDDDADGLCAALDPCPLDPGNDGDGDGVCDDVQLCDLLTSVSIDPSAPTSSEALSILDGLDPSFDPWVAVSWTVDGVERSVERSVGAESTSRDETWTATVSSTYPGATCTGVDSVDIANSVPSIDSVSVTPRIARYNSTLTCTPEGWTDGDGDAEAYSFVWEVDGVVIPGETSSTLPPGYAVGGQLVTCTAFPDDGLAIGEPMSGDVVLRNSAPIVNSIEVLPDPWEACTTEFTCVADVTDPDGDELTIEYVWRQRDSGGSFDPIEGENSPTLVREYPEGQRIACSLEVTDSQGTWLPIEWGSYTVGEQPDIDEDGICDVFDDCTDLGAYEGVVDLLDTRVGVHVGCVPTDVTPACSTGPIGSSVEWFVDGVSVSTDATLDTSGLSAGSSLWCELTPDLRDGSSGPVVQSNQALLLPNEWLLQGSEADALAGVAVSVIGDVNGDGRAELAIGAPNSGRSGRASAGIVYVVDGVDAGGTTMLDDIEAGTGGFAIYGNSGGWEPLDTICRPSTFNQQIGCFPGRAGEDAGTANVGGKLGDGLGARIAARSDVDGDGRPDLVVSATSALARSQYEAGQVYVVPAPLLAAGFTGDMWEYETTGTVRTVAGAQGTWPNRIYVTGDNDYTWNGHNAGYGLATADLDADGLDDLLIGSPNQDGNGTDAGRTSVVYAHGLSGAHTLADIGTAQLPGYDLIGRSFQFLSGQQGTHLVPLGDWDGDGIDDVHASAESFGSASYVIPGDGGVTPPTARYQDSTSVYAMQSEFEFVGFGQINWVNDITSGRSAIAGRPSGVGDVNGDGLGDLTIAWVEYADTGNQIEIATYFGRSGAGPDLDDAGPDAGIDGYVVEGVPAGGVGNGFYVGGPGDLDGDGYDETVVAINRGGTNPHRLYVIWGSASPTSLSFADLEAGIGGFTIDATSNGVRQVTGGDIDGDGLNDLVWGSLSDDTVGTDAGAVQVWFGRDVRGVVTHMGTAADDVLYSSAGTQNFVGGRGNDLMVIASGGGAMSGGAGDDVLDIQTPAMSRIDGGEGVDTMRWRVSWPLDLADFGMRIRDVEIIDLTEGANVDMFATAASILELSATTNTIRVLGESGDELELVGGGWQLEGLETIDGLLVRRIVNGNAVVLADDDIRTRVAPTLLVTTGAVDESAPAGTEVVQVFGEDPDNGAPPTVDIDLSGAPGLAFDPADGWLTVADGSLLDAETAPTLELPVTVTDFDGLVTTGTLVITVRNVNEAPSFIVGNASASVQELSPIGTLVSVLNAGDDDVGDELVYTILSGNDDNAFAIDDAGRVTVATPGALDFETAPLRTIDLQVTDLAGLSDTAQLVVEIGDVDGFETVFTMPFLVENRSLFNQAGSISALTSGTSQQSVSLNQSVDEGDAQLWDAVGNSPLTFNAQSSGRIDASFDASLSDGFVSAYLPVEITMGLPDSVPVGQPFDIEFDWTLQDDAVVWGETPGLEMDATFDFMNIASDFSPDGSAGVNNPSWTAQGVPLSLDAQAQAFHGGKFDVLFPEGLEEIDDALAINDVWDTWTYVERTITLQQTMGNLFPGATELLVEDNPNLLLVPAVSQQGINLPLDTGALLNQLGIPYFDRLNSQFQIPLNAGAYIDVLWKIYSSQYNFQTQTAWAFTVEVERVDVTVTFENGHTVTGDASEFLNITLPAGEDANGDGLVDLDIHFDVRARFGRWFGWGAGVEWTSEVMQFDSTTYVEEIDPLTLQPTGNQLSFGQSGYGPLYEAAETYSLTSEHATEDWILQGFDALPPVTGSLQLGTTP